MTITIKLLTSEPKTKYGYPLAVVCSQNGKRVKKNIAHSEIEYFNDQMQMITEAHPDYDILIPKILDIKLKARKIVLGGEKDCKKALRMVLGNGSDMVSFLAFAKEYVKELEAQAGKYDKIGDLVSRNKALGNARVYNNTVSKIEKAFPDIAVSELNYNVLYKFREDCLLNGNTKTTVSLYLRSMRSLYNKCIKINNLPDTRPFLGVFDRLKVRSSNSKKKSISKEAIVKLENVEHFAESKAKYVELFLLQFYFGGCDLIDIYFMKNSQLRNGRVRFMRGKTNTEIIIDLKVHPKAAAIIEKYKTPGDYLFPWRKDKPGYITFRKKLTNYLEKLQVRNGIEEEPDGGNLGIKVARHTFAMIAKNLLLDPDLIRELMGHERDDVDNYYKDKFPQSMRDDALFRIIG